MTKDDNMLINTISMPQYINSHVITHRESTCRYEVTLATAGIQQVGWATLSCQFTTEEGVGDSYNSYAYDGKRRRKWNMRSSDYGERWAAGDVVGVGLDLDACEVCMRSHPTAVLLGCPCPHVALDQHAQYAQAWHHRSLAANRLPAAA